MIRCPPRIDHGFLVNTLWASVSCWNENKNTFLSSRLTSIEKTGLQALVVTSLTRLRLMGLEVMSLARIVRSGFLVMVCLGGSSKVMSWQEKFFVRFTRSETSMTGSRGESNGGSRRKEGGIGGEWDGAQARGKGKRVPQGYGEVSSYSVQHFLYCFLVCEPLLANFFTSHSCTCRGARCCFLFLGQMLESKLRWIMNLSR